MAGSEERTSVRTYVPEYQKEEWSSHADALGMSQSEYVRTMVQAGRRGFLNDEPAAGTPDTTGDLEGGSGGVSPRGNGLEDTLLEALDRGGPMGWDALVDAVVGDVEDEIEETLDDLQSENRVRYSGRDGGYVLVRDE